MGACMYMYIHVHVSSFFLLLYVLKRNYMYMYKYAAIRGALSREYDCIVCHFAWCLLYMYITTLCFVC